MELITTFKEGMNDLVKYQSIVVGIQHFSVGQDHTFSTIQLEKIVKKSKQAKVKIYALVNKMIFDNEIDLLMETLQTLKDLQIDGIYFSDMAVFMVARSLDMHNLLIYAPGMTVVNSKDVKEYLSLGIQAVELANEITLEEKIEIAKNNPGQVGVVIAGYMLMSYSKRKALSNYFKEINKNIKLKDNFNLRLKEATRDELMPVYEDNEGTYIYSEYILDSFEFIKQLKTANFKYFRIDGIFLSNEMIDDLYVAYSAIISGIDNDYSKLIREKYPQFVFDNIFYTTETSEVK